MTRALFAAAVAAVSLAALPALADPAPGATVAGAFMTAAQTQDRETALKLLDKSVSIQFPVRARGLGRAQGQPFVIGYMDGLFSGQRAMSLDGGAAPRDGAVRFLAHDMRSHDRYAIDVEVRDDHVVSVTVNLEPDAAAPQAVAANPL